MTAFAPESEIRPGVPERLALRIVQIGAIVIVLVASTLTVFDLDRFFVPKEIALHLTAFVAGILSFRTLRKTETTRADLYLVAYLILGALSAAMATNRWLGLRALAISAAGVALFWTARGLRRAGLSGPLLNGLALAVVTIIVTALLQAYGLEIRFFSMNRAPGGTLGNRNFVGHAAAFGLPLVVYAALRARRFAFGCIGVALVAATLVLTRSRAAWLASGAVVVVYLIAITASSSLRRDGRTWRRFAVLVIASAVAVGAATFLPNDLHWRSENPYLESMRGVVSYDEGSGRARLNQYEHSLRMSLFHPLFGVGPGNWPVRYPEYVPRGDGSMNPSEPGMTFNPWPSSDWMAIVSERGIAAAVLLALVFVTIGLSAFRQLFRRPRQADPPLRQRDVEDALGECALVATIAAAVLAGLFDAVLLLALPTFIVWTTIGALWVPDERQRSTRTAVRTFAAAAVIAFAGFAAYRSASQLLAMNIYANRSDRASLERAARLDPGNYRLQVRVARVERRRQERCDHARAAHNLFPNAEAARSLARACGD